MKGFYVYKYADVVYAIDLSRIVSIVHTARTDSYVFTVTLAGDTDCMYEVPAAHFLAHIYDLDRELYDNLLAALQPSH